MIESHRDCNKTYLFSLRETELNRTRIISEGGSITREVDPPPEGFEYLDGSTGSPTENYPFSFVVPPNIPVNVPGYNNQFF
jgi:hypothetical protein